MEQSQNERDKRVEELWTKLDPAGTGELDLKGLQKGLRRIDHREHFYSLFSVAFTRACLAPLFCLDRVC
ncbi:hypothetical protein B0T26DRAFT_654297 [Lasiosphaeria miniovina]|uniref:EF-hand domain-containing protein n=1 Tax=Lasiosphaeria miniovina TaxID=1954250 RepID=A0AA40A460_9PEZI|nr:uncharacterized protein B0T26DRAFT_654297 [Lasiosphaeria miniovina]KAK0708955.1 hypothetical protein B0T26DRAFT_654297 [Lasiosphaeria miniovina]